MRPIELNFQNADLVSTVFDPKTKKDGAKTEYELWYATNDLALDGAAALVYTLAVHKYLYSISFFDAQKNFLGGVSYQTTSRCASVRGIVRVPVGAKFARFINFKSDSYSFEDATVIALTKGEYDAYLRDHPLANLSVALLGDSLTEGDRGTARAGYAQLNYRNYPFFLSKILGCVVLNCGKCGYRASDYLWCYDQGAADGAKDADLLLVMLGTNAGLGDAEQRKSYEELLDRITADKKKGARVVLVTPPHATEIEGKVNFGYNPTVLTAVDYARAFAAAHGYPLIDAYRDSPIQEENEALYQPNDGLHMGEEGYRAFAEFMAEKLYELSVI